jgi:hypothetical protein
MTSAQRKYSLQPADPEQPKVLCVLADGLIGYRPDIGGYASWEEFADLTPSLDRMNINANGMALEGREVSGSQPNRWREVAKLISTHYADYAGFVISDAVPLLPFHAAALSYMVGNLDKPVILTGGHSTHLGGFPYADALTNFLRAVHWAAWQGERGRRVRGVGIFLKDRLVQGNRAYLRVSQGRLHLTSVEESLNADGRLYHWDAIDHMFVQPGLIGLPKAQDNEPHFNFNLDAGNVVPVDCAAGGALDYSSVISVIQHIKPGAILLISAERFGLPLWGSDNESFASALYQYGQDGGIACVVNRVVSNDADGRLFELGYGPFMRGLGVYPLINLTGEAAWAKLAFAMGQTGWNRERKVEFLINPYANDKIVNPMNLDALRKSRGDSPTL